MKKDYIKIISILDRSGSMSSIKNDIIGGYNAFIAAQKNLKHGVCDVSLYQFDHLFDTVYENINIDAVEPLTDEKFVPRGMTALLDAVGRTIDKVGVDLKNMDPESRPEQVLFVILTDGEENASTKFNFDAIKRMILRQRYLYNWNFTYIGANQDAWAVGNKLGIATGSCITYAANEIGIFSVADSLNNTVSNMRTMKTAFAYSKTDIDKQKDAGANINTAVNLTA